MKSVKEICLVNPGGLSGGRLMQMEETSKDFYQVTLGAKKI